jgi:hypothetical protein
VHTWEAALSSTCGAIVPEKTHWCLINFKWTVGQWPKKTIEETPGTLLAKDISGDSKELRRIPVDMAAETLDICLAANGDTSTQFQRMMDKATVWVDTMKRGSLSRQEVWVALQSTITRTIIYPFPAIILTKKTSGKNHEHPIAICLASHGHLQTLPSLSGICQ